MDSEIMQTPQPDSYGMKELLGLMALERLEVNLFRGASRDIGTPRVFGGQVLAQAVLAASATIDEERLPHSLHAYFLRAGDPEAPIVYSVDRSRDGRSFSNRRVVAIQHGRPIFNLAASYQVAEQGLQHQIDPPQVPEAEALGETQPLSDDVLDIIPQKLRRWFGRLGPYEFRPVENIDPMQPGKHEPYRQVWFRLRGEVGADQVLHRALLAYASDFHLLGTATLPHGVSLAQGNLMMASLDHAMWFHGQVKVDQWLLYVCDSPKASSGRGLTRGSIYTAAGELVASTAQEGVIRVR